MRTIFDPITITADSPATRIALPAEIIRAGGANALVSLQVYECAGVVQLVGDSAQTEGSTIKQVMASDYNTEAGLFDAQGAEIYAYAASPTSITFIPVLVPRQR